MGRWRLPSLVELWMVVACGSVGPLSARLDQCLSCGTVWDEVYATGLVRCPGCYQAFGSALERLRRWSVDIRPADIAQAVLRTVLAQEQTIAVAGERFETAAWLAKLNLAQPL